MYLGVTMVFCLKLKIILVKYIKLYYHNIINIMNE